MKKLAIFIFAILTISSCTKPNSDSQSVNTTAKANVETAVVEKSSSGSYPKKSYDGIDSLFKEYSCDVEYSSLNVDLNKSSIEGWEDIETRAAEVQGRKVNFGGKYVLLQWGCGSDCQTGVIIDASTGNLFRLPTSEKGLEYRTDSLLLIINPPSKIEAENIRLEYAYPAYYHWSPENKFILLHDTREEEL